MSVKKIKPRYHLTQYLVIVFRHLIKYSVRSLKKVILTHKNLNRKKGCKHFNCEDRKLERIWKQEYSLFLNQLKNCQLFPKLAPGL